MSKTSLAVTRKAVKRMKLARAAQLSAVGLVHVTGLILGANHVVRPFRTELGKWGYKGGRLALVTGDGEVWIGAGGLLQRIVCDLFTDERGAQVPGADGVRIPLYQILARMRDPYANFGGHFPPIPDIRD